MFLGVTLGALVLAACVQPPETASRYEVPGGDAERGRQALQDYGCISCHTIPGIPRSEALVAMPLTDWADRSFIAGQFPNTPENLISWIMAPQALIPGTAMPDMGVTDQDARDMSAYLYTLRRGR
jgi:cytochrome c